MGSSKILSWLQIGSNIAILAGLVMVGLQIRQGYELERAQHNARDVELSAEFALAAMGENFASVYAKAALRPDVLTAEELMSLYYSMYYKLFLLQRGATLVEDGLMRAEDLMDEARAYGKFTYGATTFGRTWWQEEYQGVSEDQLADWAKAVNQEVVNSKGDLLARRLRSYAAAVGTSLD